MARVLAFMQEQERAIAAAPPRHTDLSAILRRGTSLDLRRKLVLYYGRPDLYGHGHAFVKALYADPFVNYYRLDSAPALHYTFVDGQQPLIVHVKPFPDAEAFEAYYGGTPAAFLRAVEAGRLLPTVGPSKDYTSTFMGGLFRQWSRLPEETWPVHANVVQASAQGRAPSDHRQEAEELFGRLVRDWPEMPKEHHWVIAGEPSGLPAEKPLGYIPTRLGWFDITLPESAWQVLNAQFRHVLAEPGLARFRELMDLVHVFQGIFCSQALYSKGPSQRVAPIDVLHWRDVLTRTGGAFQGRLSRAQRIGAAADKANQAVGLIDGVTAALGKAVPSLVRGADEMFERTIPASVRGRGGQAVLKAWERILEATDLLGGATEVKRKVQVQYVRTGGPDWNAVERLAREFEETLKGTLALPRRLHLEKSKCVRKVTNLGGTVALSFAPAAAVLVKTLDLSWKTVDAYRSARVPRKVLEEINPNFQLGLDVLGDLPKPKVRLSEKPRRAPEARAPLLAAPLAASRRRTR